jgi:hypothetical protein
MGGSNVAEIFAWYHRLAAVYSLPEVGSQYPVSVLKCFQESYEHDSADRLIEGITMRQIAESFATLGDYKEALEWERKANPILSVHFGRDHPMAQKSEEDLKSYMLLAAQKGSRTTSATQTDKMKEEAAKAEAIAADLLASEQQQGAHTNGKKKKKKKKKKSSK